MFNTQWNMEDAMRVLGNECREEGRAEGEAKGVLQSVRNLMKNLKWTAEAAMNAVGVAPADRPAILAAL